MTWYTHHNGVRTAYFDDIARKVTYWDEEGIPLTLAYTPEQNAEADARAASIAAHISREAARQAVKLIITDLQAEKARVQPVIDKANNLITGGDTKDVARAAKRIADAAIELAKFIQDME